MDMTYALSYTQFPGAGLSCDFTLGSSRVFFYSVNVWVMVSLLPAVCLVPVRDLSLTAPLAGLWC